MINVISGGTTRKIEYVPEDKEFEGINIIVQEALSTESLGTPLVVTYDGSSTYGAYFSLEGNNDHPLHPHTDGNMHHLLSYKLNIGTGHISTKTYFIGNSRNIEFSYNIGGTGEYLDEDTYTVYYRKEEPLPISSVGIIDSLVMNIFLDSGYFGTTFYPDGSVSEESYYEPS